MAHCREATDIQQKRLFEDEYRVFYDPTQRAAPVPCPTMPMYMIWHMRHQHDPAQS